MTILMMATTTGTRSRADLSAPTPAAARPPRPPTAALLLIHCRACVRACRPDDEDYDVADEEEEEEGDEVRLSLLQRACTPRGAPADAALTSTRLPARPPHPASCRRRSPSIRTTLMKTTTMTTAAATWRWTRRPRTRRMPGSCGRWRTAPPCLLPPLHRRPPLWPPGARALSAG